VKKPTEPITIDRISEVHAERRDAIRVRLEEFARVWATGTDRDLWEEMVFCFFTGGCSAKMGLRSVTAVRELLMTGTQAELAEALSGVHRYPNARARYVAESRAYLTGHCNMLLREKLAGFDDDLERRDWLARDRGVKGLGYKEASHFLRNIGFRGYAILDKHVLNCLAALKIIDDPKPPNTRSKYLSTEEKLKHFSEQAGIDFDEMDLVLWSMKTGKILK
jgi:N-glycosylase/DNA lyase